MIGFLLSIAGNGPERESQGTQEAAKTMGWRDTGKGSKHEKWTNGVHSIAIPRHKEIAEGTAKAILKEAGTYGQAQGK
jgi:hypothetical protein